MNKVTQKIIFLGVLLMVFMFLPLLVGDDSFLLYLATYFLFFAVLGAGLNLIMLTGHLSLGHAAFMGIGAYVCVLLRMKCGWNFWPSWAVAGVASGLFALIIGWMTLRIRGVYFAILTFAFGEVVRMIFVNVPVFGGMDGIMGILSPSPIGIPGLFQISFEEKTAFYYLVFIFSFFCFTIYYRIKESPIGKVLKSIEEGELLAESCGINTMRYKLVMFVLASVWAGMVGGLFACFFTYISPGSFTFVESVDLILVNVIGGVSSFAGPLVGALFLVGIPEILRGMKEFQMIIYALAIILVLYFLPEGIGGFIESKMGKNRGNAPRETD